jgi:hypothetical protein
MARNADKLAPKRPTQTELPLSRAPGVERALGTLESLKGDILALADVPKPSPVRLAAPDEAPPPPPVAAAAPPPRHRVPQLSPTLRPWAGMDPHARRTLSFKLVLNDYERTLLASVARKHGGSQAAAALRLLVAAMERELGLGESR